MIHTFALMINSPEYSIYKDFIKISNHKRHETENGNVTFKDDSLKDKGITSVEYKIKKPGTEKERRYLYAKLNLSKIMDIENPEINLVTELNYKVIESRINELFKELKLPELTVWTPNRIDYSVNLNVVNKPLYLYLIKKSKPLTYSKKKKTYETSLHDSSKSYSLNVYDKAREMREKGKPEELCMMAENIIRFELQLKNKKLNTMIENSHCKTIEYFFNPELIKQQLLYYANQCLYKSDYFVNVKVIKTIEDSRLKTKEQCIEAVNLINNRGSVEKAIQIKPEVKKLAKRIDDLGICPVCFNYKTPELSGMTFKNGLPSIYHLIEQQFNTRN